MTGGATRAESVGLALAEVTEDALVVLVHDAARPLVDDAVVERVLARSAEGYEGVVPALARRRHAQAGRRRPSSLETVSRDDLVAAQTPQAFLAAALRGALRGRARRTRPTARRSSNGQAAASPSSTAIPGSSR